MIDPTKPTIGTVVVYPVATDADGDGNDDYTGLPMTDPNVTARDGMTAKVLTRAIDANSRVFVNFVDDPGSTTWRARSKDAAGEYDGFIVHLAKAVTAPVKADWFVVEETSAATDPTPVVTAPAAASAPVTTAPPTPPADTTTPPVTTTPPADATVTTTTPPATTATPATATN